MIEFKRKEKDQFSFFVSKRINELYDAGLTQIKIAFYLGVSVRAIRKWEHFESVPNGIQLLNLMRLCKSVGA